MRFTRLTFPNFLPRRRLPPGSRRAVSLQQREMCERCGLKIPSFGLASDGKRRWCASCGVAEGGVMVDKPGNKTFGKPPVYAAGQKRARAVAK